MIYIITGEGPSFERDDFDLPVTHQVLQVCTDLVEAHHALEYYIRAYCPSPSDCEDRIAMWKYDPESYFINRNA